MTTPIRINPIPATEWEYTGSLVSVAKSTSGKQDGISQRDWKNTEHTATEEILRSQSLWSTLTLSTLAGSSTHHTWHPWCIRDLQAWHCCTGHRFLHQRYLETATTDRRIFYIQSPQPNTDWGISYILSEPPSLPPLCLLTTDSVQWAHTPLPPPTPRIPVPPAHFNALILQHSVFMWSSSSLLKQQYLT